jgi:hypothetical protein
MREKSFSSGTLTLELLSQLKPLNELLKKNVKTPSHLGLPYEKTKKQLAL